MTNQNPMECTRCGQPHGKCIGHNRAGNPCGKDPMKDQRVCGNHGGKAPQALNAAEQRRALREATLALETFGVPIIIDYQTALLEELHRTAGAVAWLGAIVADLERDDLVFGVTKIKDGGDDRGTTKEAKPNAWYVLWMDQRKHFVDVARECGKANIDDKLIKIAERDGQLFAQGIQRILIAMFEAIVKALGEIEAARVIVEEIWPRMVSEVVPAELRALSVEAAS